MKQKIPWTKKSIEASAVTYLVFLIGVSFSLIVLSTSFFGLRITFIFSLIALSCFCLKDFKILST